MSKFKKSDFLWRLSEIWFALESKVILIVSFPAASAKMETISLASFKLVVSLIEMVTVLASG